MRRQDFGVVTAGAGGIEEILQKVGYSIDVCTAELQRRDRSASPHRCIQNAVHETVRLEFTTGMRVKIGVTVPKATGQTEEGHRREQGGRTAASEGNAAKGETSSWTWRPSCRGRDASGGGPQGGMGHGGSGSRLLPERQEVSLDD